MKREQQTTTKEKETRAGMITPETGKETPATIKTESATETETPYIIYDNKIISYVDDFIELEYAGLTKEELKQDKAFFPLLVDYLYNNCICNILNNRNNGNKLYKDINLLDNLFSIYTKLVYMYKWNNKPYLIEFALFTGINIDTFYNWLSGIDNNINGATASEYLTRERSEIVQKWRSVCERALLDSNDTIKDIFILKAKHGYRDNNNDIQITVNHKAVIDADNLPDLIGINGKN